MKILFFKNIFFQSDVIFFQDELRFFLDHREVAELSELSIARGFRAIRAGYEGESRSSRIMLKKSYVFPTT